MSSRPTAREVACPDCEETAFAVIPADSAIVEQEEDSDGKVWVDCRPCGERFLVYYRTDT